MSGDTELDDSINIRRSLRRAVAESLLEKEDTLVRKRELTEGSEHTSSSLLKRVKLETLEEGGDKEGENDQSSPQHEGSSKPERKTKQRRYSDSLRPVQNAKSRMRPRHSSGNFQRKKLGKQNRVENPLRRSTREKRFVFATFNSSDMIKQIEGQHDFPVYEYEDEMDPYEKLLSPRRMPRRSVRQRHGVTGEGGEDGGASGGQVVGDKEAEGNNSENKKSESDKEEVGEEEEDDDEDDESDNSEEQSEGEGEEVGYYLRKRRPVIYQYQPVLQVVEDDTPPKTRGKGRGGGKQSSFHSKPQSSPSRAFRPRKTHHPRATSARKRQAQHHGSSSTSSSGSDSDEAKFRRRKNRSMAKARSLCLPMNFDPKDVAGNGVIRDRTRIGASLADVDPMNIDREVTFDSVGGHKHHIRALKEMIVFPLLYPEVFDRFKISPPRGVLFFGPPGCGKTLMARALANECSKGGKKVAFFMRKGADCLSKWVGESERQLRLLFDQAYQMRPSIIFFDEIDGLAPVRSSRQDQIHSSIVSTLLALMDGLDSRGEIVVIGATNRIDAIDPALRRPGRFDREFVFPLPSREDRLNILSIHTRLWNPQLKPAFLSELSDSTVGYCGADLKALCTEAALFALRRKYPQIYNTTEKLVLDVISINVQASDFYKGLKSIVPTAQRSDVSSARSIPESIRPLVLEAFGVLLAQVGFIFPPAWKSVCKASKEVQQLLVFEKKMIACMNGDIEKLSSCESGRMAFAGMDESKSHETSCLPNKRVRTTNSRSFQSSSGVSSHYSSVEDWSGNIAAEERTSTSINVLPDRDSSVIGSKNSFTCLYQSKKADGLDRVYFDLNEAVEDSSAPSMSILITDDQSNTQGSPHEQQNRTNSPSSPSLVDNSSSAVLSGQYLTLSSHPHATPLVYRPRLILCGQGGMGQSSHLAPALLHAMEDLQVRTLDLSALFAVSSKTPEEACTQIFREAKRLAPSVVYLPRISSWWDIVPETFHATFLSILLSLPTDTPLFVLATAECPWRELPRPLKELFRELSSETFTVGAPSLDQRRRFFFKVLLEKPLLPPPPMPRAPAAVELEELPVAPPPKPRELTNQDLEKVAKQREAVLRELRIFLRDTTNKLLAERKFKEFVKPVDKEEVPDYFDIIYEPMDLSTIMRKIDEHRYTTPKQWIADVNLVTRNALEYNPEHDSESRLLRHRAVALQDMSSSILDHELSEDFEKQCEEIAETYSRIGRDPHDSSPLKNASSHSSQSRHRMNIANQSSFTSTVCDGELRTELYNAPRRSLRQQGLYAEGSGFPYYSPPRSRQMKQRVTASVDSIKESEDLESVSNKGSEDCTRQKSKESEDEENVTLKKRTLSQSEPSNTQVVKVEERRLSLRNSNVRRQIIRPWEDRKEKSSSSSPVDIPSLSNGISNPKIYLQTKTDLSDLKAIRSSSSGPSTVETASEALVEITSPPNNLDESLPLDDMDVDTFQDDPPPNLPVVNKEQNSHRKSLSQSSVDNQSPENVSIDRDRLLALFERVTVATGESSCEQMERLHATFNHIVFRHRMTTDRHELLEDLELAARLNLGSAFTEGL